MAGKFLIDLTDERFFIAANEDVIAFVRRTNHPRTRTWALSCSS